MATISSIGTTGRTYSTPAAWLLAFAAGGWEGELYNDSQFTAAVSFTGHATSVTDYIILRCATGQGFRDNVNVQTNVLAFDATNGVSFSAGTGTVLITIAEDFVTISGLQIANTGTSAPVNNSTTNLTNTVMENCIIEGSGGTVAAVTWRSGMIRNCLAVKRSSTAISGINVPSGATNSRIVNCTVVKPSSFTANSTAISTGTTGTVTVENCAGFGFSSFSTTGGATISGSNNCSDTTIAFGTSNQQSKTYANQFAVTTDTGRDFKAIAGADLLDNGVTDTTNVPSATDIAGTSRPQGSAWDIGCWELVVAAGGAPLHRLLTMGAG